MLGDVSLVFVGGGIGAVLRFLIANFVTSRFAVNALDGFPLGTLVVNLLGCLLIGIAAAYLVGPHAIEREHGRMLIMVGLLGGFTTFSTFGLETLELIRERHFGFLFAYLITSNAGGIILAWTGFRISGETT